MKLWIAGLLALAAALPLPAATTCWDSESIVMQVDRAEVIVRGRVTRLAAIGCQLEDGTIEPCDRQGVEGRSFGAYAERLRVEPYEVVKGSPAEPLEFHVNRPFVEPTGPCRASRVTVGDEVVAVLEPHTGGLLAFGPVYGVVPTTREDYKGWFKHLKRRVKKTSGGMR